MIWIWLGVVIALVLVELISRNVTAGCFASSALISCILTYFTNSYMIQLGEFLVVGILAILFIRPFILKRLIKMSSPYLIDYVKSDKKNVKAEGNTK